MVTLLTSIPQTASILKALAESGLDEVEQIRALDIVGALLNSRDPKIMAAFEASLVRAGRLRFEPIAVKDGPNHHRLVGPAEPV